MTDWKRQKMDRKKKNEKNRLDKEKLRQQKMYLIEEEVMGLGYKVIAGLDEVGRGPLAGPVVAASVVFPSGIFIPEINDSKKLTPERRERIFGEIMGRARETGLHYAIGEADVEEIDRINILQASRLAMIRAIEKLTIKPDYLLIDGYTWSEIELPHRGVIGGDAKSLSIAAASIIAKVTRDRMMVEYDKLYPEYGFAKHKGYATSEHIKAISRFGPSPIHRKSFHLKNKQLSLDLEA